jgi:hypothetical protein
MAADNRDRGSWDDPAIQRRARIGKSIELSMMVGVVGWNTPRATDGSNGGPNQANGALSADVSLAGWPTPVVNDATGSQYAYSQGNHDKPVLKLPGTVQMAGWPTPTVGNAEGSQSFEGLSVTGRTPDGRNVAVSLNHTTSMAGWATPTTENSVRSEAFRKGREPNPMEVAIGPARITASGQMLTGSTAAMESGGQLNPSFSRYLMGLPIDWDIAALKIDGRSIRSSRKAKTG